MVEEVQKFENILLFYYKKNKYVVKIKRDRSVFAWRGNAYKLII